MAEIKLKVLKGTIIEKKAAKPGEIVAVSKSDAAYLIRTGKAQKVSEEVKKAEEVKASEALQEVEEAPAPEEKKTKKKK